MRGWWLLLALFACGRGPTDPLLLGGGFDGGGGPSDAPGTDGPSFSDGGPPAPDSGALDFGFSDGPITVDGGNECVSGVDCFALYGQPPCPAGGGRWCCEQGLCAPRCEAQACRLDCDCPFDLACAQGLCQPLNRPNLCCDNPDCPEGRMCVEANGQRGVCGEEGPDGGPRPDGGRFDGGRPDGGRLDGGPRPDGGRPDSGVAPIGSACVDQLECSPGFCIDEPSGFPDGYCTQDCSQSMCPAGASCRNFGPGQAFCLDSCSGPNDCRPGYGCIQLGIQPGTVCWPVPPGSGNPNGAPVGSVCQIDDDCAAGLNCLDEQSGFPGGYCTRLYCDGAGNVCPSGSSCFAFSSSYSLCLQNCPDGSTQSTCRMDYYCLGPVGQPGGCLPAN